VSIADGSALRGVHGIKTKNAGADEVHPWITRVEMERLIGSAGGLRYFALAVLDFGEHREQRHGVRRPREFRIDGGCCIVNLLLPQEGAHQPSGESRIVRRFGQRLAIESFRLAGIARQIGIFGWSRFMWRNNMATGAIVGGQQGARLSGCDEQRNTGS